jgi:hypothetical protein
LKPFTSQKKKLSSKVNKSFRSTKTPVRVTKLSQLSNKSFSLGTSFSKSPKEAENNSFNKKRENPTDIKIASSDISLKASNSGNEGDWNSEAKMKNVFHVHSNSVNQLNLKINGIKNTKTNNSNGSSFSEESSKKPLSINPIRSVQSLTGISNEPNPSTKHPLKENVLMSDNVNLLKFNFNK